MSKVKSTVKKDKLIVTDEVWTEDRVKDCLAVEPLEGVNADFHMLQKAYQSMRADDFEIFVGFFLTEKRDINAVDPRGNTVLTYAKEHRNSGEFVKILGDNGAV